MKMIMLVIFYSTILKLNIFWLLGFLQCQANCNTRATIIERGGGGAGGECGIIRASEVSAPSLSLRKMIKWNLMIQATALCCEVGSEPFVQ